MKTKSNIDWLSFLATIVIIFLVCIPLALFPDSGGKILLDTYNWISSELGFMYLACGSASLVFVLWLGLGRFGNVRLGLEGEEPDFNLRSWAAMLFCAGIGAGLLAWAPIEWGYYLDAPPFGVEARSPSAAEWASTYGIFHWGITAWALYCLPSIAIAYSYYVKRTRSLRFAHSCLYLLRGREDHPGGRILDWLFMIGILGGAGSSLGFSTPMIAGLLARLTGIEADFTLDFTVIMVSVALFATSVWLGLKRGIKRLSVFNMWLAFVLLVYILAVGPTRFLLDTSVNSIGLMLQNFIRMNTWTGAFTEATFVKNWTIFYWAWWIAYGPFVGLFVTRISKGRSIREMVFGMLGFGTLGCAVFFMTVGNYGLYLELMGIAPVSQTLAAEGAPNAIGMILGALPLGGLFVAAYALVGLIFSVTTYDSASYTLASSATRELPAGSDPERWHRVFWACALAIMPLTLMVIGGLKVVQTATLVVSLPLVFVSVAMAWSLTRQLQLDHR